MRKTVEEGQVVSGGQMQQEIDAAMKEIVGKYPELFKGIGQANIDG